jgi:hypothetical protein
LGFLIVVVQVLRSSEPLSFKLAVVGLPALFLYSALIFQLGRRYEWDRLKRASRKEQHGGRRSPGSEIDSAEPARRSRQAA